MRNLSSPLGIRNPLQRAVQAMTLCVAMMVMLGAGGASRYDKLGHEMMCQCGCSQILMECNHVGCPVSPVMLNELQAQLAGGGGNTAVENWFVAKYGAIVLAAPIRGGFDNVAWIAPIAVFVLATFGTAGVVWVWKRRSGASSLAVAGPLGIDPGTDSELRERIRRETEYR